MRFRVLLALSLSLLWCALYVVSLIQWIDVYAGLSPRVVFIGINDGYLRLGLYTDSRYAPPATNGVDISSCTAECASFGFGTPHWFKEDNWGLAVVDLPILWVLMLSLWLSGLVEWARRRKETFDLCRKCKYSLFGITSEVCPECGAPIPEEQKLAIAKATSN